MDINCSTLKKLDATWVGTYLCRTGARYVTVVILGRYVVDKIVYLWKKDDSQLKWFFEFSFAILGVILFENGRRPRRKIGRVVGGKWKDVLLVYEYTKEDNSCSVKPLLILIPGSGLPRPLGIMA